MTCSSTHKLCMWPIQLFCNWTDHIHKLRICKRSHTQSVHSRVYFDWKSLPQSFCKHNIVFHSFIIIPLFDVLFNVAHWTIPDFRFSTAIVNIIGFFRRWCKLNFRLLRGHVKSCHFPDRIEVRRKYFYIFIQISWQRFSIMIWVFYYIILS